MAKKMIRKKKNSNGAGRRALRGFAMALLTLALTLFLTGFITGGYFLVNAMTVVGGEPAIDLDQARQEVKQTTQIIVYDKGGNPQNYWQLHGEENRVWVGLKDMGASNPLTGSAYPLIADAYVALEDKRFFDHHGVDWTRFVAIMTKFNFSQGASTLTQQLIKNITEENDVTAVRKYREILSALNLERHYDKDVILEAYLNKLYLGRGCYGVKTGAERYFDKDISELNIAECASLAAITQNPHKLDPLRDPKANKDRQKYCLESMLDQGKITQAQYDEAVAFPLEFKQGLTEAELQQAAQQDINPYYVDFIIDTVISDLMKQKDMSQREATNKVYGGGLKIYAAVDLEIQAVAEDVFRKRTTFKDLTGSKENPIHAAMTIMDYEGRVLAIVGGAGEKTQNRGLNRAAQSWRQPGSTIKPLSVYGPALEKNLIHWSTMIENSAFAYKGSMWPHNVDGTYGSGKNVTVQNALKESMNTVAARVVNEKLKVGEAYKYLDEHFGFTRLDPVNDGTVLPSMAVGSMRYGFSTLEECAAYAVIGNGGVYCPPYCYYRVLDSKGEPLLEHSTEKKQAFSEETAKVLNQILQTVDLSYYITGGNGKFMSSYKTFAKTGTTNDNKDRWFAGGTPYFVASVWFGYDIPKDLGQMSNPSAKIWMEIFNRIHGDLDPAKDFPKTSKAVQKSYCTRTGLLAGPSCDKTASGWYKVNNTPKVCASCERIPDPVETTTRPQGGTNWWEGLFTRPN